MKLWNHFSFDEIEFWQQPQEMKTNKINVPCRMWCLSVNSCRLLFVVLCVQYHVSEGKDATDGFMTTIISPLVGNQKKVFGMDCEMVSWLTEWLADRLANQPTERPTDSPTDLLTDWLSHWLTRWLTDCLLYCLTDWFSSWIVHQVVHSFIHSFFHSLTHSLTHSFIHSY